MSDVADYRLISKQGDTLRIEATPTNASLSPSGRRGHDLQRDVTGRQSGRGAQERVRRCATSRICRVLRASDKAAAGSSREWIARENAVRPANTRTIFTSLLGRSATRTGVGPA